MELICHLSAPIQMVNNQPLTWLISCSICLAPCISIKLKFLTAFHKPEPGNFSQDDAWNCTHFIHCRSTWTSEYNIRTQQLNSVWEINLSDMIDWAYSTAQAVEPESPDNGLFLPCTVAALRRFQLRAHGFHAANCSSQWHIELSYFTIFCCVMLSPNIHRNMSHCSLTVNCTTNSCFGLAIGYSMADDWWHTGQQANVSSTYLSMCCSESIFCTLNNKLFTGYSTKKKKLPEWREVGPINSCYNQT